MPEPLVLAADVRDVLRASIRPDDPDEGLAVQRLAEAAHTSTRTVYRCLNPRPRQDGARPTLKLDLADRLVMACGRALGEVAPHLVLTDDQLVDWGDV